jgi:hypothetical protein
MIGNLTNQEVRRVMDLTVKYYFEGLTTEEARKKAVSQFRKEKGCANSQESK